MVDACDVGQWSCGPAPLRAAAGLFDLVLCERLLACGVGGLSHSVCVCVCVVNDVTDPLLALAVLPLRLLCRSWSPPRIKTRCRLHLSFQRSRQW